MTALSACVLYLSWVSVAARACSLQPHWKVLIHPGTRPSSDRLRDTLAEDNIELTFRLSF